MCVNGLNWFANALINKSRADGFQLRIYRYILSADAATDGGLIYSIALI